MGIAPLALRQNYWEEFQLQEDDLENIYNHLLENETPLTADELVRILVTERIKQEKLSLEQQHAKSGDIFLPNGKYQPGQKLQFPALNWQQGKVAFVRDGHNPELPPFQVIEVDMENGEKRYFAAGLENHKLNTPVSVNFDSTELDPAYVLRKYGTHLVKILSEEIENNPDIVRIAGRWFPRALLVDINIGHLNLAEAILEVAEGGPVTTRDLMDQLDLPKDVNPKLTEFSLNLALQEDGRFDEVGPSGKVLWYLKRLEPESVQQPPTQLRCPPFQYSRESVKSLLDQFEGQIADELDNCLVPKIANDEVTLTLLYPHFRVGTLPVCEDFYHFFPTAYESPRVQFTFVDGDTDEKFSGWVVREHGYAFGLRDWYQKNNCIPGSLITIRKSTQPGEVIIFSGRRRPTREWVRTAMVGVDGGVVYAMLKHSIATSYDERMAIVISDQDALDRVWEQSGKQRLQLTQVVKKVMRELAKLSPQGHVHAQELYAALNVIRRSPPGPILAILLDNPWAVHLGDLYFRIDETEEPED